MERLQRNRVYELVIGSSANPQDALRFTNHQITFDIKKSSDNTAKANTAVIQIYNLVDNQLKFLEADYPVAVLSVGYSSYEDLKRLVVGEVTHYKTIKSGADKITHIYVSQNYTGLNHSVLSTTAPPGSKVIDAIQAIRTNMTFGEELAHVITGDAVQKTLLYGFPLSGSPKDMLNKLSRIYGFEWRVDDNTLYVNDADRAEDENFGNSSVISRGTGLIENAYYEAGDSTRAENDPVKKNGVRFRMLIDAALAPGQIVTLKDTSIEGFFKIDDMRFNGNYRGANWFADVKCSALEKVVKN